MWLVDDITQAREHDERMRRTFEAQQMIFDNAAVGILFATRRKVVRCNQAMGGHIWLHPGGVGRSIYARFL